MMQHLLLFSALILLLNNSAADEEPEKDGNSCSDCTQINIKNCISGEMRVEEKIKGHISVSQLSEGDVIRGIKGNDQTPAWCKVEAIFAVPHSQNQTTYDGFTADHMVISHTVHPYGKRGEMRVGPVYTLATDCDASVNSAGQAFTPISTAFCPHELSWSDYLTVIAAVRRVTNRAGNFWYNLNVYHDNATAKFTRWIDQLPVICQEVLQCSQKGRCQGFENVMAEFVHDHLNEQYVEVVERVFPNMGGDVDKEQAGTMTEVVRPKGSSHIVLFSAVGGAIVLVLIIAVASILVYRGRLMKKKVEKELEPTKTGDVLA